jgi:hypothetical protein
MSSHELFGLEPRSLTINMSLKHGSRERRTTWLISSRLV